VNTFVFCLTQNPLLTKYDIAHHHDSDYKFAFSVPGWMTFKQLAHPLKTELKAEPKTESTSSESIDFKKMKRIFRFSELTGLVLGEESRWETLKNEGHPDVLSFIELQKLGQIAETIDYSFQNEEGCVVSRQPLNADGAFVFWKFHLKVKHQGEFKDQVWLALTDREEAQLFLSIKALVLPEAAPSRAYLKAQEVFIRYRSAIQPKAGDHVVEVGSSPGGMTLAWLEKGCRVTGIDPGVMAPSILLNRQFTHIKRSVFYLEPSGVESVQWLVLDVNASPNVTFKLLEPWLRYHRVTLKGVILTLKLNRVELVSNIQPWVSLVKRLGFRVIGEQQLIYNRQEMTIVAVKG
jgi:hypothetical protein